MSFDRGVTRDYSNSADYTEPNEKFGQLNLDNHKVRKVAGALLGGSLLAAAIIMGIYANSFDSSYSFCTSFHTKGVMMASAVGLGFSAVGVGLGPVLSSKNSKEFKDLTKLMGKLGLSFTLTLAVAGTCGLALTAVPFIVAGLYKCDKSKNAFTRWLFPNDLDVQYDKPVGYGNNALDIQYSERVGYNN